jgi:hypothetical protein
MRRVDRLSPQELDDVTELLIACVAQGASLGFHAPLAADVARKWWAGFPRDGVMLLVAEHKGRALMMALENEARAAGKTLLVLDTREGDPSNDLYRALGYREAGRIPGWARDAAGTVSATVFWYKPLDSPSELGAGPGARADAPS